MHHAVFLDAATLGPDLSLDPLRQHVASLDVFEHTPAADVIARCQGKTAVFTNKVAFSAETLAALPELQYIGLTATGTDPIDLDAAEANDVAVANIVAYCTPSVVQHVFGGLLALTHNTMRYADEVQRGAWQAQQTFCMLNYPIRELDGLVFGIIGYGELGQAVGSVAEAFGMRVVVAARDEHDDRSDRMPLAQLLQSADVVSLHCPLNARTRHLINRDTLALMKRDAVLINTARGGLVDAAALAEALQQGQIGGAALDVLEPEPPQPDNLLLNIDLPQLIITPHTAWGAKQARDRAVQQSADAFAAYIEGHHMNRVTGTHV
ncbi:MAG: D-2-hydroxyacid dehydrogenase [Pseudomonadota bacterium]